MRRVSSASTSRVVALVCVFVALCAYCKGPAPTDLPPLVTTESLSVFVGTDVTGDAVDDELYVEIYPNYQGVATLRVLARAGPVDSTSALPALVASFTLANTTLLNQLPAPRGPIAQPFDVFAASFNPSPSVRTLVVSAHNVIYALSPGPVNSVWLAASVLTVPIMTALPADLLVAAESYTTQMPLTGAWATGTASGLWSFWPANNTLVVTSIVRPPSMSSQPGVLAVRPLRVQTLENAPAASLVGTVYAGSDGDGQPIFASLLSSGHVLVSNSTHEPFQVSASGTMWTFWGAANLTGAANHTFLSLVACRSIVEGCCACSVFTPSLSISRVWGPASGFGNADGPWPAGNLSLDSSSITTLYAPGDVYGVGSDVLVAVDRGSGAWRLLNGQVQVAARWVNFASALPHVALKQLHAVAVCNLVGGPHAELALLLVDLYGAGWLVIVAPTLNSTALLASFRVDGLRLGLTPPFASLLCADMTGDGLRDLVVSQAPSSPVLSTASIASVSDDPQLVGRSAVLVNKGELQFSAGEPLAQGNMMSAAPSAWTSPGSTTGAALLVSQPSDPFNLRLVRLTRSPVLRALQAPREILRTLLPMGASVTSLAPAQLGTDARTDLVLVVNGSDALLYLLSVTADAPFTTTTLYSANKSALGLNATDRACAVAADVLPPPSPDVVLLAAVASAGNDVFIVRVNSTGGVFGSQLTVLDGAIATGHMAFQCSVSYTTTSETSNASVALHVWVGAVTGGEQSVLTFTSDLPAAFSAGNFAYNSVSDMISTRIVASIDPRGLCSELISVGTSSTVLAFPTCNAAGVQLSLEAESSPVFKRFPLLGPLGATWTSAVFQASTERVHVALTVGSDPTAFLSDSASTPEPAKQPCLPLGLHNQLTLADWNLDGNVDLGVFSSSSSSVDCGPSQFVYFDGPKFVTSLKAFRTVPTTGVVVDLDLDGRLDAFGCDLTNLNISYRAQRGQSDHTVLLARPFPLPVMRMLALSADACVSAAAPPSVTSIFGVLFGSSVGNWSAVHLVAYTFRAIEPPEFIFALPGAPLSGLLETARPPGSSSSLVLTAVETGDVNGDRGVDIVATNGSMHVLVAVRATTDSCEVLAFQPTIAIRPLPFAVTFGAGDAASVAVRDFSGDGIDDVVVAVLGFGLFGARGSAASGLDALAAIVGVPSGAAGLVPVNDINGDGRAELVLTSVGATTAPMVRLALAQASTDPSALAFGLATVPALSGAASWAFSALVDDVNADGAADVFLLALSRDNATFPTGNMAVLLSALDTGTRVSPRVLRVDVSTRCGYFLRCVHEAIARASAGDVVEVPGGIYTGCFSDPRPSITRALTLRPVTGERVVFNCTTGLVRPNRAIGAMGWHVTASLTVSGITFAGFFSPSTRNGGVFLLTAGNDASVKVATAFEVSNCTFVDCFAAGVDVVTDASPTSGSGGALYVDGFVSGEALVHVRNSSFVSCSAAAKGGAIAFAGAGSLSLTDVAFDSCSAGLSGGAVNMHSQGMRVTDGPTLDMLRVDVSNSYAGSSTYSAVASSSVGGGAVMYTTTSGVSAVLRECTFVNCQSLVSGGALALVTSSSTATSVFATNVTVTSATAHLGVGGAIWAHGRAWATAWTGLTVTNSRAVLGGALGVESLLPNAGLSHAIVLLDDSRLANNMASRSGGAIYLAAIEVGDTSDSPCVMNVSTSTVHNNTASEAGGALALAIAGARGLCFDGSSASGNSVPAGFGGFAAVLPQVNSFSGLSLSSTLAVGSSVWPDGTGAACPTSPNLRVSTSEVRDNKAKYGGVVATCESRIELADEFENEPTNTATGAGGLAFVCPPKSCPATASAPACCSANATEAGALVARSVAASQTMIDRYSDATRLNAPLYGPLRASEPQSIVFNETLPPAVPVGVAFGTGRVTVLDAFDQRVVDSTQQIAFEISGTTGVRMANFARRTLVDATAGVSLADASLALTSEGHANTPVGLLLTSGAASVHTSVNLTDCVPGLGRVQIASIIQCTPCVAPAYQNKSGSFQCSVCASDGVATGTGTYGGSTACIVCAANSALANTSSSTCLCAASFYRSVPEPNQVCAPCPTGGVCTGGTARPYAQPGYFDTSPNSDGTEFTLCRRPGACVGGLSPCAPSSQGYMCNECKSGFYTGASGACEKCPNLSAVLLVVFLLLVVLALAAVIAFILFAARARRFSLATQARAVAAGKAAAVGRPRLLPRTPSMALMYLQIVGVIATSNLAWSSTSRGALTVFSIANLDLRVFASECTIRSFWSSYALTMSFPMFVSVLTAAMVFLLRSRIPPGETRRVLAKTFITFAQLAYVPMARTTLTFFDCSRLPNKSWALDADLSQPCFSGQWVSYLPVALIGLALNVAALPALGVWQLLRARNDLGEEPVMFALGGLYLHLRRRFWFFELVNLAKRLSIVMASLFFSELQVLLLVVLVAILGASTVAQARLQPFYLRRLNTAGLVLDGSATIILGVGVFEYSDKFPSGGAHAFVVSILVVTVIASLIFIAYALFVDVREYLRARRSAASAPTVDPLVAQLFARVLAEATLELGPTRAVEEISQLLAGGGSVAPEPLDRDDLSMTAVMSVASGAVVFGQAVDGGIEMTGF